MINQMKKPILALLSIILLLNIQSKAQSCPFKIGLGLEGALPSNGFNITYGGGAGATLRLSKGVSEHIAVTLTSGAIAFFPKSRNNSAIGNKASLFIPVKGGAKLMLSDRVYLMGELGVTFLKSYVVTNTTGATPTYGYVHSSNFTYGPGLGIEFGLLDFNLRYENLKGSGFIGLRVGYNF